MIFYILAPLFFVNASDITEFDYEKYLNSTSLDYEKIFAESSKDYLNYLTANMKIDLMLEDNKDKTWKNYVEKVKSIQPNYQQILNVIKEKKNNETDVVKSNLEKKDERKNNEEKTITLSPGKLGIEIDEESIGYIHYVDPGSKADKAGLKNKCTIISIDDKPYSKNLLMSKINGKEKYEVNIISTNGIVSKYFEGEKLKERSPGKDIIITNIVDNASNFDYEKFLNSISLQYEKILAKSFEDYLNVLTENMKIDLILEDNVDQNDASNTIWNNYVQKIRDAKPIINKFLI